jgi:hypothetical protein
MRFYIYFPDFWLFCHACCHLISRLYFDLATSLPESSCFLWSTELDFGVQMEPGELTLAIAKPLSGNLPRLSVLKPSIFFIFRTKIQQHDASSKARAVISYTDYLSPEPEKKSQD